MRRRVSRKASRRMFRKGSKSLKVNSRRVMRGGIRL